MVIQASVFEKTLQRDRFIIGDDHGTPLIAPASVNVEKVKHVPLDYQRCSLCPI